MKTIRCLLCLSAGVLLLAVATATFAQESYPSRPIRLVVPFGVGGGADTIARLVGPKLSERLGQQAFVDNRPGATGMIGTDLVAKASPDGYTLLLGEATSLVISPLSRNAPYDPVRDLAAVSPIASIYHVLVIHPSIPAKSVKELIAYAKAHPGEINYASTGPGGNIHLITELFKTKTGINMTHIPFKGTGPASLALVAGQSHAMFTSISPVLQFVRTGKLVALAVTSPNRSPLLPEVPTLKESGLHGIEVAGFYALMAPAGTPREIIAQLNTEAVKIVATPDFRQKLVSKGFEPFSGSPEQLSAYLKTELEKWGEVIKAAGIKGN